MALKDPNVAGFLVEPIQGEAGVYTPSDDYVQKAQALCEKAGVLFIADEVQTGIARTGSLARDLREIAPALAIVNANRPMRRLMS